MDLNNELNKRLKELSELLPTIMVIGITKDGRGAMFMGSPKGTDEKRKIDLMAAVAMMMEEKTSLQELILAAVSWYLQKNPEEREKMQKAIDIIKERHFEAKAEIINHDGHPGTAEC
jgi:hypothetical protein